MALIQEFVQFVESGYLQKILNGTYYDVLMYYSIEHEDLIQDFLVYMYPRLDRFDKNRASLKTYLTMKFKSFVLGKVRQAKKKYREVLDVNSVLNLTDKKMSAGISRIKLMESLIKQRENHAQLLQYFRDRTEGYKLKEIAKKNQTNYNDLKLKQVVLDELFQEVI